MDFGEIPNPATVVKIIPPNKAELPRPPSSSVLATTINKDKNKRAIPDELTLLLNQPYISTEDLIKFRLVSKSWRDEATSILLKRNASRITLRKQRLRVTSREDPNYKTYSYYNCRYRKTHKTLNDLTSLISTSPQFPVSSFGICGHRRLNNKFNRYNDHSELHRFLSLHGTHIKTLRLEKSVSVQELELYNKYLVNLESLELDGPFLCKTKDDEDSSLRKKQNLKSTCHFQSITTLCINYFSSNKRINKTELLRLILNSPTSQLKYVQNVELDSLQVLLEVRKVHLITMFNFSYMPEVQTYNADKVLNILQEFAKVCSAPDWDSRLLTLRLDLLEVEHCPAIVDAINVILDSCKDSLDQLDITYEPVVFQTRIIIPPMENLTSLILIVGDWGSEKSVEDGHVFQFGRVSHDSVKTSASLSLQAMLPKLYRVRFILNKTPKYNKSSTFLEFFKMVDSEIENVVRVEGNFLLTVKILETNFICTSLSEAKELVSLFPNVIFFKNRLDPMQMFQNTFWAMCPLAKSIEIWDILWVKNSRMEMVDQFLTGFPFEICEKMRNLGKEDSLCFLNEGGLLKFLKMLPAIRDMSHLRMLTLKFEVLASQFTSHVSATYALEDMSDLKINVSYDPAEMNAVDGPQQIRVAVGDGYLACIAPFAKIVHEEQ